MLVQVERVHLLQLALPVLLRRETSVNRRFHAWLLSSPAVAKDNDKDSDEKVVGDSALDLFVDALLEQMKHMSLVGDDAARPFNLARTLMERGELRRSRFVEQISLPLIHYAHYYNEVATSSSSGSSSDPSSLGEQEVVSQQVLKAAQSYFNQVNLDRVWHSLLAAVEREFEAQPDDADSTDLDTQQRTQQRTRRDKMAVRRIEILGLVDFALDFLPVHYHHGHSSASDKVPALVDTVLRGLFRYATMLASSDYRLVNLVCFADSLGLGRQNI